jgi:iron-sulfur cluster assembly protein/iron-sulfur cluster insertion protein
VKVVVDPASAQLLVGASLDYKDGLNQAGFAITNPNASRTCGCGQSFS